MAQLEQMAARAESDNRRLTKELLKARRDVENLSEMFVTATEGVNAKSAYRIPEVPSRLDATTERRRGSGQGGGQSGMVWNRGR